MNRTHQTESSLEGMHTPALRQPMGERDHAPAAALLTSSLGATFGQLLRFGLVGCLNTAIDLLALNGLFWLFPTRSIGLLLIENSLAYSIGAVNSFLVNRWWTFHVPGRAGRREVGRFALTTLAGVACNNLLLWLMGTLLHPVLVSAVVWANASKLAAIGGTVLISYLGMRLWVFVRPDPALMKAAAKLHYTIPMTQRPADDLCRLASPGVLTTASLSVVLPIYNEAATIRETVEQVLRGVAALVGEFEVILVNDGSTDETGAILASLVADPRIRLITHQHNQGYGAALVDGFAAATKTLTFFTDADGQFDGGNRLSPGTPGFLATQAQRLGLERAGAPGAGRTGARHRLRFQAAAHQLSPALSAGNARSHD